MTHSLVVAKFAVRGLVLAIAVVVGPGGAQAQAQSPPSGTASPTAAAKVQVDRFKVTGNTLLPAPAIDAELAPYKGERTLDELKRAAAAVQALYATAGFGAVVAYLPPQAPSGGIVDITVVEGRITKVAITGNTQFSEANVRASLPALKEGTTPALKRIDSQIQIANENPSKQVQVLLQPGAALGQAEAKVTVSERPVQRWTLGLDNTGNTRTGDLRASVAWQHANVLGRDHVATVQFQTAPDKLEAVKVLSGGYRVPLYEQQIVLDAYAAYSDVDGGNTAITAGNLQFNGRGRLFALRASHYLPRLGEIDQRVSLGIDSRDYINNCQIVGQAAGACGPAGESVSVQPLSLEYSAQKGGVTPVGITVSLNHNLQIGGGNSDDAHFQAVRPGAKPHYDALRLNGFVGTTVYEDWQLQGRVSGQWTTDALVPAEQFGLGGAASVRGYQEREIAGDRGLLGSFELIGPSVASGVGLTGSDLRLLGFIDAGTVSNRLGTQCLTGRSDCTLASLGVGARLNAGALQGRLYVANARKTAVQTEKNDWRLHFGMSYAF